MLFFEGGIYTLGQRLRVVLCGARDKRGEKKLTRIPSLPLLVMVLSTMVVLLLDSCKEMPSSSLLVMRLSVIVVLLEYRSRMPSMLSEMWLFTIVFPLEKVR